jgi:glycosyltransferase involved in cell wall biosynthesis
MAKAEGKKPLGDRFRLRGKSTLISVSEQMRGLWTRGQTVAIVQFEAVHEEVIPSVCHALKENGITPTVFLNREILTRRGDIFARICPGEFDYHYVPVSSPEDWHMLKTRLLARKKDAFVFINTYQRPGIAKFGSELGKPVLGIVHNPQIFLSHEDCVKTARAPDVGLMTLADHAASYLIAGQQSFMDKVASLTPLYWGPETAQSDPDPTQRRRVVVPGAVNFSNRNYDFLFDAFVQTPDLKTRLEVRILGGGPDRAALENRVIEAGLETDITFSTLNPDTGFVDHQIYFDDLRRAAFVLPLLPLNRQDYRTYKITAALSTAQGFCIPPLLDRWTAMVYRIPALQFQGAQVQDALVAAADMPDADYAALRAQMHDFRADRLARNAQEMAYLIAQT